MPKETEGKKEGESVEPEKGTPKEGEEEKVDKDPKAALEDAAAEEASEGVEEAPSPFTELFKDIPEDDRGPLLARYIDGLPDDEKVKLPWVEDAARKGEELSHRRASQEERDRQAISEESAGKQSSQAVTGIEDHLDEVRQSLLKGEKTEFNIGYLKEALESYATAESQIRNRGFIRTISTQLVSLIDTEGDPLTPDQLQKMLGEGGGTFQDIFRAYVTEYGSRRYNSGLAAGEEGAQSRDSDWRKTELAAMRAEIQKDNGGPTDEPDTAEGTMASALSNAPLDDKASPAEKISAGLRSHRKVKKGKI